jgi:transcriptional regulator with XRE-family HTH domain
MKWSQIRAQYERAFRVARDRGETQTTIAMRGGLLSPRTGRPQQNQISKILRSGRRGPSVETFVRAIEGLGISVSAFFAAVETGEADAILKQVAERRPDTADLLIEAARLMGKAVKTIERAQRRSASNHRRPRP